MRSLRLDRLKKIKEHEDSTTRRKHGRGGCFPFGLSPSSALAGRGYLYPVLVNTQFAAGASELYGDFWAVTVAASQDQLTLRLGKPAPDSVGLGDLERVFTALLEYGAVVANGLGAKFTLHAGASAFAVWVVEDVRILPAASTSKLPIPKVSIWTREQVWLGHVRGFSLKCANGSAGDARRGVRCSP